LLQFPFVAYDHTCDDEFHGLAVTSSPLQSNITFAETIARDKPDYVAIQIGVNDVWQQVTCANATPPPPHTHTHLMQWAYCVLINELHASVLVFKRHLCDAITIAVTTPSFSITAAHVVDITTIASYDSEVIPLL
jgi:hypothetical protein